MVISNYDLITMYFDYQIFIDDNNLTINASGDYSEILIKMATDRKYPIVVCHAATVEAPLVVIDADTTGTTTIGALTENSVTYVSSINAALQLCGTLGRGSICTIIGDSHIHAEALSHPYLRFIGVTKIDTIGNTVFSMPKWLNDVVMYKFKELRDDTSSDILPTPSAMVNTVVIDMLNYDEVHYLNLVERLMSAPVRKNRTEIPTRGLFHEVLRFDLYGPDGAAILPLITSKKTNFAAVYHELIWFLRGSTDTAYLKEHGVTIWDGNSSREYLDKRGLTDYKPGEVGPIYGFQWRHYGAKYINKRTIEHAVGLSSSLSSSCEQSYNSADAFGGDISYYNSLKPAGIDQLADVIKLLKTDPSSRRMMVMAWNPAQNAEMALPPCHFGFQFHVDFEDDQPKYLNCLVLMRSADTFLGVPFNIASYALLTHIVAKIVGLTPKTLALSMTDCHLYTNHLDGAVKLIKRIPTRFPTITFGPAIMRKNNLTIDDFANRFKINDYNVNGYAPQPYIKVPMAV